MFIGDERLYHPAICPIGPKFAHSVYEGLDRSTDYGKFMEKDLSDLISAKENNPI